MAHWQPTCLRQLRFDDLHNDGALMSDDEGSRRNDGHNTGPQDSLGREDRANKAIREASLRERLQAQLTQLRLQVRRLNQILAGADEAQPRAPSPPTDSSVEQSSCDADLPRSNDAQDEGRSVAASSPDLRHATPQTPTLPAKVGGNAADGPAMAHAPAAGRQTGTLILLEITETDIRAMIHAGLLSRADITNPAKIGACLQMIVARWRATVPLPATPSTGNTPDRRSGRDRRRGGPRSSSLLSYVAGTEFDRRKGGDRRRRKQPPSVDQESPPLPANLVTLDELRAKRQERQRHAKKPKSGDGKVAPVQAANPLPIRRRRTAAERTSRVDSERKPDEAEGRPMIVPDRLTEDEDRQQKVGRRGDVLDDTERRESDPPGGSDEQEKR